MMNQFYRFLGYFGALPFLIAGLGGLFFDETIGKLFLGLQFVYSGLILSFLSGIHWSHAFPRNSEGQMIASILPTIFSLIAICVAFLLIFGNLLGTTMSTVICSALLGMNILGFFTLYILDLQHLNKKHFPDDYFAFRLQITTIVCVCLALSILGLWV